jgi:membrane protein required for colicin V production
MTPVDYLIVGVCLVSAGVGLWRGLAKEALSLLTLLAAIWLAWRFAFVVEPYLGDWAGGPEVRIWVARLVLFVLVLAVGALVAWLARTLIKHSGLTGVDRLFGAAFGLLRGVVVVGLAVIALEFAGLDQDPWWREARLRPYADRAAAAVRYYAELGTRYLTERQVV